MQHRHDHLCRRAPLLRVHVHGNAATVIADRHRFVGVNRHGNRAAVPGQRLIDRVINDLEYQVMKAGAIVGIADVHARPFANGVQAL